MLFRSWGALRFELISIADPLDEFIDSVFRVAAKGWAYQQGSAICSTPELRGFYADLIRMASLQGWLRCYILKLEERPIAFDLCLQHHTVTYNLKIAYDEEFAKYSPGELLRAFVLKQNFADDVREFDFLGDTATWKHRWANGVREHLKVYVFNSTFYARWLQWFPLHVKELAKSALDKKQWDMAKNHYLATSAVTPRDAT